MFSIEYYNRYNTRVVVSEESSSSGSGTGNPFPDDEDLIYNVADETKTARFSAAGIATGTQRVYALPDHDGTNLVSGGINTMTGSGATVFHLNGSGGFEIDINSDVTGLSIYAHGSSATPVLAVGATGMGYIPFGGAGNAGDVISNVGTNGAMIWSSVNSLLNADLVAFSALSATPGMVVKTGAAAYAVRTITGTVNSITVFNGSGAAGNPLLSVSSTYAGGTSIVTLGTVATGTWSATNIALAKGGTGSTLIDPGANSLWGWDDTDNTIGFWTIGSGLSYDHASHTLSASGTGGITNAAAANELMKSDATNAVASGFFSTTAGSLIFGSASISGSRTLTVSSSTTNASLTFVGQGTGSLFGTANAVTTDLLYYTIPTPTASTSITITEADRGKVIITTSSSAVSVSLSNGLTTGFYVTIVKGGTGTVTITAATTLNVAGGTASLVTTWSHGAFYHTGSNVWNGSGQFGSGGVSDADYGDITVSSSGAVWTIDNAVVTGAKIASSVALAGSPTTTTQAAATNDTTISTTAYNDLLANGKIKVGNVSNVGIAVTPSGVITMTNAGAFSFAVERIAVTGTSTLTGDVTVAGAFNFDFSGIKRFGLNQTYTATANNDYLNRLTGTFTARATASDNFIGYNFTPTLVTGAATQIGIAMLLNPTFTATGGAFSSATIIEARGSSGSVWVNSTGALSTTRGLNFNANASAGANNIVFTLATGTVSGYTELQFTGGSLSSATRRHLFSGTFAPTSGTGTNSLADFITAINQTGGANGATGNVVISLTPTAVVGAHKALVFNTSSTANVTNPYTAISIEPTMGTGTFYSLIASAGMRAGLGQSTPTATLHISAGSTSASSAPIKLTSGSLMTAPEIGAFEFLTDKAYFTITTGTARVELTLNNAALTSGNIPIATTNGRLTDSGITASGGILSLTGVTALTSTYATGGISVVNSSVLTRGFKFIEGTGNVSTTGDGNADNAFFDMSSFPNNTVFTAEITVDIIKSDGSEGGGATFIAVYRKDNSGTYVKIGDSTAVPIEDCTGVIATSTVLSSSFIQVRVSRTGTSGNFRHGAYGTVTFHSY